MEHAELSAEFSYPERWTISDFVYRQDYVMKLSFDPAKSEHNRRNRNLPFERARHFDFGTALYLADARFDDPDQRFVGVGYLDDRLHVLVFAALEDSLDVISFRKANEREAEKFGVPQKRYR